MAETSDDLIPKMVATSESALSRRFGHPVKLGEPQVLRDQYRNRVVRCPVLDGAAGPHQAVVIKASLADDGSPFVAEPDESGSSAWRYFNELGGTDFLFKHAPDTCAELLASDPTLGVLVLEDLGDGDSLANVIQREDPAAAEAALTSYALGLARMHAGTVGLKAEWRASRLALGGTQTGLDPEGPNWIRENVGDLVKLAAEVGVTPAAGFDADIESVRQEIDAPGAYEAFSPNDTCPDNHRLMPDGSVRFFDFEFAGFRHALLDAAYLQVPFPTCWCVNRFPAGMRERLGETYRQALSVSVPAARDIEQYERALSACCAFWALMTVSWNREHILKNDDKWGIATQRQRHIVRLNNLAERLERFDHLPAIAETCRTLQTAFTALWPDLEPMPIYPAFRAYSEQSE